MRGTSYARRKNVIYKYLHARTPIIELVLYSVHITCNCTCKNSRCAAAVIGGYAALKGVQGESLPHGLFACQIVLVG